MNTKLKMNNSPHIVSNISTKTIMRDVIIALTPALIAGIIFFGLYALAVVSLTIATCVLSEFTYNKIRKRPITISDMSAVVTGLILGLNLPPDAPLYIPIIGGVFAIILVKMLFGGLGKNFANPAATARVFLLLAYVSMTKWIAPFDLTTGSTYLGEGISATTISNEFWGFTGIKAFNLQLFIGTVGGSIGETSALAILIGCIYLTIKKIIDLRITLAVIFSSAFFALAFSGSINYVLPQLLSGGLLFGAVFMATDYATSPMTLTGKLIFGFGIGLITMLIRFYGSYPEGMSLAIVFMNLLVPLMDKYIVPVRFGEKRKSYLPFAMLCASVVMTVIFVIGGLFTYGKYNYEVCDILNYKTVDGGYEITAKGYVDIEDKSEENFRNGSVTLKIVIKDKKIYSVSYVSDKLTPLRGGATDNALTQDFLKQYEGTLERDNELISGATTVYTLKAVNNCMDGAVRWYIEELGGGK